MKENLTPDFEEALYRFQAAVKAKYGPKCDIVKIAVTPDLFQALCWDLQNKNRYGLRVTDIGDYRLFDIQILPREKDKF